MKGWLLFAFVAAVCGVAGVCSAQAEDPSEAPSRIGAQVCNGFNPDSGEWGDIGTELGGDSFCSRGYALMSFAYYGGTAPTAAAVRVNGSCCALPPGALTDEHQFSLEECPEDHVATGTRAVGSKDSPGGGQQYLRCTKIDTTRFALGERRAARRMGLEIEYLANLKDTFLGRDARSIPRTAVPVSLRYGLLRESYSRWHYNGCIGEPFGSLLVGKRTKRCDDVVFRALVDKVAGAPVAVLPPCKRVDDPLSPVTRCIE